MELEILKLIYDYSINGRLVDKIFINKIIEIVVKKKDLNNYIRNVYYTNSLEKNDNGVVCAAYSTIRKEMVIDFESIKIVIENKSYYDQLFHSFEQIMFRNLTITQFILHEIEHAFQNKQSDNKSDNSIETRLIKACLMIEQAIKNPNFLKGILTKEIPTHDFIVYILQSKKLYEKYYNLNPIERLAQINSFRTIVNSIEPIKQYIPNLYEFKQASLVESALEGYVDSWEQGICPTEVYLSGTRQGNVWLNMDFYDQDSSQLMKNVINKYNLVKRLSLGLPISSIEYNSCNEWLQNTNKFNV